MLGEYSQGTMQTNTRPVSLRLPLLRVAAALAAFGLLSLTGCGGAGGSGESDPTPTPTATTTPTPTPTPSPTPTATPAVGVVTVTPVSVTVSVGDTRPFTATITGDDSLGQAVLWNVREGSLGGTISAGGLYAAPAVPGTYHVTATSTLDSSRSGSATVIVQAGSASGSIQ